MPRTILVLAAGVKTHYGPGMRDELKAPALGPLTSVILTIVGEDGTTRTMTATGPELMGGLTFSGGPDWDHLEVTTVFDPLLMSRSPEFRFRLEVEGAEKIEIRQEP